MLKWRQIIDLLPCKIFRVFCVFSSKAKHKSLFSFKTKKSMPWRHLWITLKNINESFNASNNFSPTQTNHPTLFLAKFMGEEKPPPYQYPPGYAPMPPQPVNAAPAQPASGGAGGAKNFFPIYDSNRFFRV